jgi:hypothetical protein
MRFSIVLTVVAALTVSISATPLAADTPVSASETDSCATFCVKSSQCCDTCVSSLRPVFNRTTHRHDRLFFYA